MWLPAHNQGDRQPPAGGDVVGQSGDRLKSGQLGTADVTASTVANIGPGIDFYFGFGVIAVTAGAAAPLTILAATVAVVLLAFTVAEFTRSGIPRNLSESR
jgi:amino acid transporter